MGVDRAQVLHRQALATELRCEGRDYAQIAEIVGYASKSGAWYAVQRALESRIVSAADHLVATTFVDLELIQEAAWPAAMGGDVPAATQVLRAIDLRLQLVERFGAELGFPDEWMLAADAADAHLAVLESTSRVCRDPEDVFESRDVFAFVRLSGTARGGIAVVQKADLSVALLSPPDSVALGCVAPPRPEAAER